MLVPIGQQVVDLNGLIILNASGRFLWEKLVEDFSMEDLARLLAEEFNIDRECAKKDTQAFINEIAGIGLLE